MEIPRLVVELEVHPPATATAAETPDLSLTCDLSQSLWQCQILNPMSEAWD